MKKKDKRGKLEKKEESNFRKKKDRRGKLEKSAKIQKKRLKKREESTVNYYCNPQCI
jgi:hypothetical protein